MRRLLDMLEGIGPPLFWLVAAVTICALWWCGVELYLLSEGK